MDKSKIAVKARNVHWISVDLDEYGECIVTFDIEGSFYGGTQETPPERPEAVGVVITLPDGETWYEDDMPEHLQQRIDDLLIKYIDNQRG